MNILFFGTPPIAVPYLEWLIAHQTVVGVVCQPDKPAGRGYTVTPPATKKLALLKNIPVFQPAGPWRQDVLDQFTKLKADVGVVVAYGRILPEAVFNIPRLSSFNIHFSLLPKYRGAAPLQWALVNGETETGLTLFWLNKGMDSGEILSQASLPISSEDDIFTLREKTAGPGLNLLENAFADFARDVFPKKQQEGTPTLAPLLEKENGRVNWSKSARDIYNLARGLKEWPGAWTMVGGKGSTTRLKILKAQLNAANGGTAQAGEILEATHDHGITVQTGEGHLSLLTLHPEGKKPMPAWDFWQGAHLTPGDKFL